MEVVTNLLSYTNFNQQDYNLSNIHNAILPSNYKERITKKCLKTES